MFHAQIEEMLEDIEDNAVVKAAKENGGEHIPWEEIKKDMDSRFAVR